jgi:hypothetical protein
LTSAGRAGSGARGGATAIFCSFAGAGGSNRAACSGFGAATSVSRNPVAFDLAGSGKDVFGSGFAAVLIGLGSGSFAAATFACGRTSAFAAWPGRTRGFASGLASRMGFAGAAGVMPAAL